MAAIYRISDQGEITRYSDDGTVVRLADGGAIPIPQWLIDVITVRGLVRDPIAPDYLLAESLPATGKTDAVYFLYGANYDGQAWRWNGAKWVSVRVITSNEILSQWIQSYGINKAAIMDIDSALMSIDPTSWIQSFNAGAESTSKASLSEILAFWTAKKAALQSQIAGMKPRTVRAQLKRVVGYVPDRFYE